MSALLLFAAIFYGLATLTYGVSCPTGLFVPSILCGAAYGRLVRAGRQATAWSAAHVPQHTQCVPAGMSLRCTWPILGEYAVIRSAV